VKDMRSACREHERRGLMREGLWTWLVDPGCP